MDVERIFKQSSKLNGMALDTVLFESKYPVLFTCKQDSNVYLFICCQVNYDSVKWIGTRTSYNVLIQLLENKLTIRDAFNSVTDEKILVEYDGRETFVRHLSYKDIPEEFLPTTDEYMDAEDGEYDHEIEEFKFRNEYVEYPVKLQTSAISRIKPETRYLMLTNEYYIQDNNPMNVFDYFVTTFQNQLVRLR